MDPTLSHTGEDALLGHFRRMLPSGGSVLVGPGDDCAVVELPGPEWDGLLKTDALVEGIHFQQGENPRRVGHKALARVLSDIAAMGGWPREILVTLALSPETRKSWLDGFYDGLLALAARTDCRVAGGELSGLPSSAPAVISLAATGIVPSGRAVLRSGGRAGDVIAVTGSLGGSLESGRHLDFSPRLPEGRWLAQPGRARAMMDLSDGLAKDLPRLACASGCNFLLRPECLPCHTGVPVEKALADGEDYELLVALPAHGWEEIQTGFQAEFPGLPLTAIGELSAVGSGADQRLVGGWDHFAGR